MSRGARPEGLELALSKEAKKVIDPGELSPKELYQLMISIIVPRPIALVSTLSQEGVPNLAPFSFFNGVSAKPPLVSLSIAKTRDGEKDTMRNIRANKEFVINVVDTATCEAAVLTSGAHPPNVDEFEVAALTKLPADKIAPFRVKECPVQFECVLVEMLDRPGGADVTLVIGRVMRFHVARKVWHDRKIHPEELDPAARLGESFYSGLGPIIEIQRPEV